jgi:hypothetical protein
MELNHMNDDETQLALDLAEQMLEKAMTQLKKNQQTFQNIINWQLVPYERSAPILMMVQETRNKIAEIEARK